MAKVGAFWSRSPADFAGTVNARVYELTRGRAIAIFEHAVEISPVDTGAYRQSWTVSEGAPKVFYAGKPADLKIELPPPSAPTNLSTKFYRKFFVTNGAPYAMRIEHGWSGQAPQGVLRQAIRATAK